MNIEELKEKLNKCKSLEFTDVDINDLEDLFGNQVEAIIDGGIAKVEMSTILDFTTDEMEVLREGKGFDRI